MGKFIEKEEYLKQRDKKFLNNNAFLEEIIKEKARRLLARKSFKEFIGYVLPSFMFSKFNLDLIEKLQMCYEGKLNRLIVNMPPRHGKTLITSTLFPLWVLGNSPGEEFMLTSYGVSLSSEIIKGMRPILTSQRFKNIFPDFQLITDKEDLLVINNSESKNGLFGNGKVIATGFSSPMTGKGFTYGIVDDPVKSKEESMSEKIKSKITDSFTHDFYTRQQVAKKSADKIVIIIIMTRRSVDDLVGFLLEKEKEGMTKYEKLVYKGIQDDGSILFPEKFTLQDYEQAKIIQGPSGFEALYQQNPIKAMGDIFKKETFNSFYRSDLNNANGTLRKEDIFWGIFIDPAWSTSKSSDDLVIMLGGQHKISKDYYILDINGGKVAPSEGYNQIFGMYDYWTQQGFRINFISLEQVAINKNQTKFKTDLVEEMKKREKYITLYDYSPTENKHDRIQYDLEPLFQNGKIYILNKEDTGYNKHFKTLEEELLKFPNMSHDDYPDTASQMVRQIGKYANYTQKKEEREKEKSVTNFRNYGKNNTNNDSPIRTI